MNVDGLETCSHAFRATHTARALPDMYVTS
jgi:hypothetical protein